MSAHCPSCGRFAPFDTHPEKIHADYCKEKMKKMMEWLYPKEPAQPSNQNPKTGDLK